MGKSKSLVRREPRVTRTAAGVVKSDLMAIGGFLNDDEDCDQTATTTTTTYSRVASLTSTSWRLRLVTRCRNIVGNKAEWKMHQLHLHGSACSHADASNVLQASRTFSSGLVSEEYPESLLSDGDETTYWLGEEDSDGDLYVGFEFTTSVAVKCIRFVQCDCQESARQVVLEAQSYLTDWTPASFNSSLQFGEWTEMDVA